MKTVLLNEEQLADLGSIASQMIYDENDPRSTEYVRKLTRPRINWFKIIIHLIFPIIVLFSVLFAVLYFHVSLLYTLLAGGVLLLVYFAVISKRAIICTVRIYQHYAPDHIRNKCRFEPSCSEYMIMAIEKYGVLKGVKKGIGRLKRCNVNNGGFDFP